MMAGKKALSGSERKASHEGKTFMRDGHGWEELLGSFSQFKHLSSKPPLPVFSVLLANNVILSSVVLETSSHSLQSFSLGNL